MEKNDPKLRPIPTFPDYYVNEEAGEIWSFKVYKHGHLMKPQVTSRWDGRPSRTGVSLVRDGKQYNRTISRLVMNITDPTIIVDHINRDVFQNQKSNLRPATPQKSNYNRKYSSKTGFRGVQSYLSIFRARLWTGKKLLHLGIYSNIYEAAAVRNVEASKIQGEFAIYNKVDGLILTL